MNKFNFHLEYIWLDGNYPQQIRSKTKIVDIDNESEIFYDTRDESEIFYDVREYFVKEWKKNPEKLPMWNFDGSSTGQAETSNSELLLKPVNIFIDPFKQNGFIVVAEVYHTDMTPHKTNKRARMVTTVNKMDEETMYGLEQEYFIYDKKTNKPLGWPIEGYPRPQGDYYCSVGGNNVSGRDFVEEHTTLCEIAGLKISGINAEVTLGQWEYQIGPVFAIDGSDQLWVSRYILDRLSEKYNYYIVLDPKPYKGNDWNGSGMHVNFSTKEMRNDMKNKKKLVIEACEKLSEKVQEHIDVYGLNNEFRLTGSNETCSIKEFRYGIGDRTASIRIPSSIEDKTTPGYLEDRRPASNGDPYEIINRIIKTVCGGKSDKKSEKKKKKEHEA
jgi:glutamine synthetase